MGEEKITLREAVKFHGHLGPYLVLGLKAGELALKKLKCKKYFGLEVKVWGVSKKPKSCLVDGLQLSTGATYGKGNINKFNGAIIKIELFNRDINKGLTLLLKNDLIKQLSQVTTHAESELLAKKIYKRNYLSLFNLKLKN